MRVGWPGQDGCSNYLDRPLDLSHNYELLSLIRRRFETIDLAGEYLQQTPNDFGWEASSSLFAVPEIHQALV